MKSLKLISLLFLVSFLHSCASAPSASAEKDETVGKATTEDYFISPFYQTPRS